MPDQNPEISPQSPANSPDILDFLATAPKSIRTGILLPSPAPISEPRLDRYHRVLCCHIKPNGQPCGSPALTGRKYCYFHYLWRTERPRRRSQPKTRLGQLPLLEDPNAVQLALQQVLNAIVANRIDLPRARLLLYGLQTAAVNVLHTEFDPVGFRSELATELDL